MPDAKRTRHIRDASEELTLEEHIATQRKALVDARNQAPVLRAQADALCAKADGIRGRWQQRHAADLRAQGAGAAG